MKQLASALTLGAALLALGCSASATAEPASAPDSGTDDADTSPDASPSDASARDASTPSDGGRDAGGGSLGCTRFGFQASGATCGTSCVSLT